MQKPDLKIKNFARQFSGKFILPSDKDYDEARRLWNGLYDKYPIGISVCSTT